MDNCICTIAIPVLKKNKYANYLLVLSCKSDSRETYYEEGDWEESEWRGGEQRIRKDAGDGQTSKSNRILKHNAVRITNALKG